MENCLEKVFVGVDCHKDTIACYLNGNFKEFKTTHNGYTKAVEWVNKINPNSAWAIEGAYSYGITLSKFLLHTCFCKANSKKRNLRRLKAENNAQIDIIMKRND